jgi:hypothetical protein
MMRPSTMLAAMLVILTADATAHAKITDGTAPARRHVLPAKAGIRGSCGARPAPGRRTARLADPSCRALSPSISLAKPIPTVLVTAYPDDGVRERAPSAGVIG